MLIDRLLRWWLVEIRPAPMQTGNKRPRPSSGGKDGARLVFNRRRLLTERAGGPGEKTNGGGKPEPPACGEKRADARTIRERPRARQPSKSTPNVRRASRSAPARRTF